MTLIQNVAKMETLGSKMVTLKAYLIEVESKSTVASRVNAATLYHGSGESFDKFDMAKIHTGADSNGSSWYGEGIYLSGETWKGQMYAYSFGSKGMLYEVKAIVKNPLVVNGTGASDWSVALKSIEVNPTTPTKDVTAVLKSKGYDSVVVLGSDKTLNEVVIFDYSKVKIISKKKCTK